MDERLAKLYQAAQDGQLRYARFCEKYDCVHLGPGPDQWKADEKGRLAAEAEEAMRAYLMVAMEHMGYTRP